MKKKEIIESIEEIMESMKYSLYYNYFDIYEDLNKLININKGFEDETLKKDYEIIMVNYYQIKETIEDLLADINDERATISDIQNTLFKMLDNYKAAKKSEKEIKEFIKNND